jgi:hypothetical protein
VLVLDPDARSAKLHERETVRSASLAEGTHSRVSLIPVP